MKNYTFVLILAGIMSSSNLFAQSSITGQDINKRSNPIFTPVPFMTLSPDSRHGGTGDAGVASSPDVSAQHWNAAKYVFCETNSAMGISYTPWLRQLVSDINLMYVSGFYKLDDIQSLSSSLKYFSMGNINLTTAEAKPIGTQNPNEFAIDFGYSRKLSKKWSGGVVIKYIRSDLYSGVSGIGEGQNVTAANAFAADVSFFYNSHWKTVGGKRSIAFGVNMSNIGSKISYDETQKYYQPANLKFGTSYSMQLDRHNSISLHFDVNKLLVPTPRYETKTIGGGEIVFIPQHSDMPVITSIFKSFADAPGSYKEELQEIMLSIGAEYWYMEQFALRAGYFYEDEKKGNRKYLTFGLGLKMNVLGLDFSYLQPTIQNNPLQNTLRFTLSFDLGTGLF